MHTLCIYISARLPRLPLLHSTTSKIPIPAFPPSAYNPNTMEALERFAFLILYIFFPVSRYVLRTPYIRM